MTRTPKGRASIFRGKADGVRIQGVLTKAGGQAFERRRRELAKVYREVWGQPPTVVSDADVIEYLALGLDQTVAYLKRGQ